MFFVGKNTSCLDWNKFILFLHIAYDVNISSFSLTFEGYMYPWFESSFTESAGGTR
jgi:hypothetical protein